jgi:hypothetical protein
LFFGLLLGSAAAHAENCKIIPYGDIGKTWQSMPSPNPFGCALEDEKPDPSGVGRTQHFQFGQITWSAPSRGNHAILAAYQAGNAIELQWAGLEPYHYDFFIARTDRNGTNIDQQDVKGGPSSGWFVLRNNLVGATYSFVVEGCDEKGILGEGQLAGCRQHWLNRADVTTVANPNKRAPTLPDAPKRGTSCFLKVDCIKSVVSEAVKAGTTVANLF